MADFVQEEDEETTKKAGGDDEGEASTEDATTKASSAGVVPIKIEDALEVIYCPTCSLPPEYCEFSSTFNQCLPWIVKNCPEVLDPSILAKMLGEVSLDANGDGASAADDSKASSKKGGVAPRKKVAGEVRVVISSIQRQKRKYVTVVCGLETVPELKIKDAAKLFGKKFSSGASVGEDARGQKEVVIQGDVSLELPQLLITNFKVAPTSIYFLDEGSSSPRPYA